MANRSPDSLAAYTVVLLHHAGRYLLLQRAASKQFAPRRWTGIGGRVEAQEYEQLSAAARRKLYEEAGIRPDSIAQWALRRGALLHARPGGPLTMLLYFTGSGGGHTARVQRGDALLDRTGTVSRAGRHRDDGAGAAAAHRRSAARPGWARARAPGDSRLRCR